MLFLNLLFFLLKSFAEYRWYLPKIVHYLINANEDTLSALIDSSKPERYCYRYYRESDMQWQERVQRWQKDMLERKFTIFLDLFAIDPAITVGFS